MLHIFTSNSTTSLFLILDTFIGVWCYLTVVLVCISLIKLKTLSMWVSYELKCLFKFLVHLKNKLFSYYWVLYLLCIFWMQILYWIRDWLYAYVKTYVPVSGLFFHSLCSIFHRADILNFHEVQLINCFFYGSCL